MPIRLKLALWYGGVLAVIMTVFSGTLYFLMYNSIQHQYRSSLQEQTEKVYDRLEYTVRLSLRGWNIDVQLDAQDMFFTENIYLQLINISNRRISMSTNAVEDGVMIPVITENILRHLLPSPLMFMQLPRSMGSHLSSITGGSHNSNQLIGVLQGATYSGQYDQPVGRAAFRADPLIDRDHHRLFLLRLVPVAKRRCGRSTR